MDDAVDGEEDGSGEQLQLGRGSGVAVLGSLLHRLPPALLDVVVLMSVQLSVDQARLLYQLHKSFLLAWRVSVKAPAPQLGVPLRVSMVKLTTAQLMEEIPLKVIMNPVMTRHCIP